MDTFKAKIYLTIIEEGSLSKAGIKLGYSTSGISQLMNSFEKEMGFPLLIRQKRGTVPTTNGLNILPILKNILKEEERLNQIKSEINGLIQGSVRIGAYSSVSTHWLPKIIKKFQLDYPNIEISLMEGIRQEVDSWLKNREVDIGFLSYKENMIYDWIPLKDDPLLAVLPKIHPLATKENYPLKK